MIHSHIQPQSQLEATSQSARH